MGILTGGSQSVVTMLKCVFLVVFVVLTSVMDLAIGGLWSEWSTTNFNGNPNLQQLCNPGTNVISQQWMEQDDYGLINLQFTCSDGMLHRMTTNERGSWNKVLTCEDGSAGFSQMISREQGGYGLINVAVNCLGTLDFEYSNNNFRGSDNMPLACPAGTKTITGFQTREQNGYGLVNFRYYCE